MLDLEGFVGRVDRRDCDSGELAGVERDHELDRIGKHEGAYVALLQAEVGQSRGKALHHFPELTVGHLSVQKEDRGL